MTMMPDPRFNQYLEHALGASEAAALLRCIDSGEPATSVRVNPAKHASLDILADTSGTVPWHRHGYYLQSRPRFTFDPALHQGLYYVQEASSMFVGHVVSRIASLTGNIPLTLLDSCAAPGGKTTAAADMLPDGSVVVANEYDRQRASVLAENVAKWGNPSVIVTQGDTARFRKMHGAFDIVIADAPCSGEGMMRKDQKAVEQWSPALVSQCADRQREILDNITGCIAPGGFLIYSTCTFNREEDEEIVERLVEEFGMLPVDIDTDPSWGILSTSASGITCHRFLPSRLRGEGLFMAVMRAPGDFKPRSLSASTRQKSLPEAADWVPSLIAKKYGETIYALPPHALPMLKELESKSVNIIAPGVEIATVKGRDIIPAAPLAFSSALSPDAFMRIEVSHDEAIAFLRRDAVVLPSGTPRGHILLTRSGYPLGFVKNLGNRSNNLYPANWRIRSNIKD